MIPKFTQAFGFAVDTDALQARMQQSVDMAQQVVSALHGKITTAMVDQVVGASGLDRTAIEDCREPWRAG